MDVKIRILMLRLMDRIEQNPCYARKLGLEVGGEKQRDLETEEKIYSDEVIYSAGKTNTTEVWNPAESTKPGDKECRLDNDDKGHRLDADVLKRF